MKSFIVRLATLAVCLLAGVALASSQPQLTLQETVALAQQHDPWLSGSRFREQASKAQSVAAGELPDPTLSLGLANLPIDNFEFDAEPMTQFKVAVNQVFPRGDTLNLQRKQLNEISAQQPYLRQDRKAKVAVSVAHLWLDNYRSREAIRLIEKDRALFDHLVDVAQSSYTSGIAKSSQQDLVRAQLELTRLEDRLTVLQEQREISHAKLSEWISSEFAGNFQINDRLPTAEEISPTAIPINQLTSLPIQRTLLNHPMIKNFDQKIIASSTRVQIVEQKYKPQWGVNASYGYRDDDPMGNDRSDFFSVAVSFDMPLFTENRQDKSVQSAVASVEAIRTDKALALRAMRSRFEIVVTRLQRLTQREDLYERRLLKEIHDQADASLSAYTNDVGDFSEVVRARIAELNAKIDFLNIEVDKLKILAELNYFFTPDNKMQYAQGTLSKELGNE